MSLSSPHCSGFPLEGSVILAALKMLFSAHISASLLLVAFNVAAGVPVYECYCRDSEKRSSRKECFLEENDKPTKAFFYEILKDDEGRTSARTKHCDVDSAGQNKIRPFPGCTLDHFNDKKQEYTYREYTIGERSLNQEHQRPFTKLKKVSKKDLKTEYKQGLIQFVSSDPKEMLYVTKKGEIKWQNPGHIEEGRWSKEAGNVRKSDKTPYFSFPDGRLGYFSEGVVILLKPSLSVLAKNPLLVDALDARHPDSPHSSDDEEPPR